MILEYLGGIETVLINPFMPVHLLILEYLGGIETSKGIMEAKCKWDFRIPRRDWNQNNTKCGG